MAAKNFTFQNLDPGRPGYVNMSRPAATRRVSAPRTYDYSRDDVYSPFYDPTPVIDMRTAGGSGAQWERPSLRTLARGASPDRTRSAGAFDYSMFGTWDEPDRRGGSGSSMWGDSFWNLKSVAAPRPTGTVSVASSQVIKPSAPLPTLGPAAPFVRPEKTDTEPRRRKEMGRTYRRLSQVVAQALSGIGDEDVMGIQKRRVLQGFGDSLSSAGQAAERVAAAEGAREDALNMQEAQQNWQASEQTRLANFNAALQDYFKQYRTQVTSAKRYTYERPSGDRTYSIFPGRSSLPWDERSQTVNLGNIVNRYFR